MNVDDLRRQFDRLRERQAYEERVFGYAHLLDEKNLQERAPFVVFIAVLTTLGVLATLFLVLKRSSREHYAMTRKPRWAPGRSLTLAFLLSLIYSVSSFASLLAVLKPEANDLLVMLSRTAHSTILTFYTASLFIAKDLSLSMLCLMMVCGVSSYQLYLFSELFVLSTYLELAALTVTLYLFAAGMKQWITTELPEALKAANWDKSPVVAQMMERLRGQGGRRHGQGKRIPPTATVPGRRK
jgi:hypothetical protein